MTDETLIHSAGIKREKQTKKERKKKKRETNDKTMTKKKTLLLNSQTRGMHTSSAEYTTFITFEPINRKSGGKATHITAFRKLREEEQKKKNNEQTRKAAQSINESTCPRGSSRGKNRVR